MDKVELIVKVLKDWRKTADKFGVDSSQAKEKGSIAMPVLFENRELLPESNQRFQLRGLEDVFTIDEIKTMNDGGNCGFYADRNFIADIEKTEVKQANGGEKTDLAKVPISELIKQGESHSLEFKETLEYDTHQSKGNKDVLRSSLKTISGFLNAEGGTMLIGIDDLGKIRGIERDLSIMKHGNNDRFEQKIRNCLKDRFKPQPIGKVNISFEKFTEGMICRVDIQTSKEIVHLDNEVYVRDGNTTQKLEGQSLTDWIQQRSN